ncbi:MAG: hypothetical protein JWQ11_774 [Rhizobacter sp.]|nr:hypothetical protein [Rhizobacter sp.]
MTSFLDTATTRIHRRTLLRAAAGTAIAASAGIVGTRSFAAPRKITFAWNDSAF